METQFATLKDIKSIREILQKNLVDIDDLKLISNQENKGFLIRNIGEKEIEKMIEDGKNNLVLVAKENDEVLGYLISSRLSEISQNLQDGISSVLSAKKITDFDQIIYHRQIAVKAGFKNVGSFLMADFFKKAKLAKYQIIACRIIHQPALNERSILFHKRFGFDLIGEVAKSDLVAGVYIKNL